MASDVLFPNERSRYRHPLTDRVMMADLNKAVKMLRHHGLRTTCAVVLSVIEDLYIRAFDRRYGVCTSGYIPLSQTALEPSQAQKGHRYRPVNAWAFRRVLREIALSKELRFVDLGCGLGTRLPDCC